jgi:3'-5' exoribonuclease
MIQMLTLSEAGDGQLADFFLVMTQKEEAITRNGKPYYKVAFRDAGGEVAFPIWSDATWALACRDDWQVGVFYKVRAVYRESDYGPQLDIEKIREITDADRADGFSETMLLPRSRFSAEEMFGELVGLVTEEIDSAPLKELVLHLLESNRESLLSLPAAVHNHHAYVGGFLEHVLSVTKTAIMLANHYQEQYPDLSPPLDRDLVVAGAVLHDIGKLAELRQAADGAHYTAAGELLGHIVLGRDLLRDAAKQCGLEAEAQLRLEHIILSHQRLPEWGSPKPPMTPEALIVHYADDLDAKYQMMYQTLGDNTSGANSPAAEIRCVTPSFANWTRCERLWRSCVQPGILSKRYDAKHAWTFEGFPFQLAPAPPICAAQIHGAAINAPIAARRLPPLPADSC